MWRAATVTTLDDATLQALIDAVLRYVDQWGYKPSPKQLRAALGVVVPEHRNE